MGTHLLSSYGQVRLQAGAREVQEVHSCACRYGLDTSQFTYSPPVQPGDAAGGAAAAGQPAGPQGDQQQGGSRCSIM